MSRPRRWLIDHLSYYKNNVFMRSSLILMASFLWWFFFADASVRGLVATLVVFTAPETFTINFIFERDFYPASWFAEFLFERDDYKNNYVYVIGYFILICFLVWLLWEISMS